MARVWQQAKHAVRKQHCRTCRTWQNDGRTRPKHGETSAPCHGTLCTWQTMVHAWHTSATNEGMASGNPVPRHMGGRRHGALPPPPQPPCTCPVPPRRIASLLAKRSSAHPPLPPPYHPAPWARLATNPCSLPPPPLTPAAATARMAEPPPLALPSPPFSPLSNRCVLCSDISGRAPTGSPPALPPLP